MSSGFFYFEDVILTGPDAMCDVSHRIVIEVTDAVVLSLFIGNYCAWSGQSSGMTCSVRWPLLSFITSGSVTGMQELILKWVTEHTRN